MDEDLTLAESKACTNRMNRV